MRKKLAKLFMMLAIATMMAHMFLPHHEHENRLCVEQLTTCDSSGENTTNNHNSYCLSKQQIIRTINEQKQDNSCDYGLTCDVHFPPILLFLGDFYSFSSFKSSSKPYINLYTSVDIHSTNFLRGPPQA